MPKFKTPKKQESLVKDPISQRNKRESSKRASQPKYTEETIANLVKEPIGQILKHPGNNKESSRSNQPNYTEETIATPVKEANFRGNNSQFSQVIVVMSKYKNLSAGNTLIEHVNVL